MLAQASKIVLRELLAMAICHSKSKVLKDLEACPLAATVPFALIPGPHWATPAFSGPQPEMPWPLRLLLIPKEIYLKAWHSTFTKAEFGKIVSKIYGDQ